MKTRTDPGTKRPSTVAGDELSWRSALEDEALRAATGGTAAQPVKKFSTNTLRFDPYKAFKFR